MTLVSEDTFEAEGLSLGPIESGTSILLTGDDGDALASVFYRLVAPDADGDERAVVLATEESGRTVRRSLDRTKRGSGDRAAVLACTGTGDGGDVRVVDDLGDLTRLGMDLSSMVAEAQGQSARFRTGMLLCSSVCAAAADMRSVYRLLNSTFLPELRRGDGIGVCALDTSADVGTNARSVVAGMNTSFSAHVEVERTGRREATLTVSGLGDDRTTTVSL
ncbi:hypothetical protein ACFO0N_11345 [Halobium salinum]|uniref:Uncharacterized protein n=1 Tax=Halobium salinum TaxID=1364940 RepID=A0ABD5PCD5_9EURY|nr:hypothetical protein [Halobium salinum]